MVLIEKYAAVNESDCIKIGIKVLRNSLSPGYRTLVVLDDKGNNENKKVVGIIRTIDILDILTNLLEAKA